MAPACKVLGAFTGAEGASGAGFGSMRFTGGVLESALSFDGALGAGKLITVIIFALKLEPTFVPITVTLLLLCRSLAAIIVPSALLIIVSEEMAKPVESTVILLLSEFNIAIPVMEILFCKSTKV